jgi:hypothetical protein
VHGAGRQREAGGGRPGVRRAHIFPCPAGAWSHTLKVWDLKGGNLDELACCRGHEERVCGLAWMPTQVEGGGGEGRERGKRKKDGGRLERRQAGGGGGLPLDQSGAYR